MYCANFIFSKLIAQNYRSVTQLEFQPYKVGQDGKQPLPNSVYQAGSGFIRQKPITAPLSRSVTSVCIDTKAAGSPADILPRAKPILHKIQSKDPVELENAGYGPGFMTTESSVRFQGQPSERSKLVYFLWCEINVEVKYKIIFHICECFNICHYLNEKFRLDKQKHLKKFIIHVDKLYFVDLHISYCCLLHYF